jgi:cysteine-rich repeat protein
MSTRSDLATARPGAARRALGLAPLALVALLAAGCQKPDAVSCPTGIYCPAGTKCAARQAVCLTTDCGDGVLQAGEVCDDGNLFDGDGCSSTCRSDETCGNGVTDRAAGEQCDDWNRVDGDGCSAGCKRETCGNGRVDAGEECDPGHETAGCDVDCTYTVHGDGYANTAAGEQCDGGTGASPSCESAACNGDCTWGVHGDGKINPQQGEQCDGDGLGHGNGVDCQSPVCNWSCTRSRHGDGIVNPQDGEQCDGGTGSSASCQSATCNADCTTSVHGDGKLNPLAGEECDGGAGTPGDDCQSRTCNSDCTTSAHGDGKVNPLAGELCDGDGLGTANGVNCQWAGCNADCTLSRHGDGKVNPLDGEECDGGTGPSASCLSTTCNADCTTSRCGDGKRNPLNEQCDDGNAVNEDDCVACQNASCGDGFVASLGTTREVCDLGSRNGASNCEYGLTGCAGCRWDCQEALTTSAHYCGDGRRDVNLGTVPDEVCDAATSFVCGTCSLDCRIKVAPRNPVGTITLVSTPVHGDFFTIDDATTTVTFTFDADGTCTAAPGLRCIDASGTPAPSLVVSRLRTAIAGAGVTAGLAVTVSPANDPGFVTTVVNVEAGVTGNLPITAGGATVSVQGMSGGVGCPLGGLCASGGDCISKRCGYGICKPW